MTFSGKEKNSDGEDETGKPYKYDCLAKDFENMEIISKIEMKAIFEIPNLSY